MIRSLSPDCQLLAMFSHGGKAREFSGGSIIKDTNHVEKNSALLT